MRMQGQELWRGSWVIFTKHIHKFVRNGQELGGTLAAPLLLAATFGLGMDRLVTPAAIDGLSYLSFITPGIIAFTALSGAINAGMTILEERMKGVMKEYLVAPIPRASILLAATGSGLVKSLVQSLLIVLVAVVFGARVQTSPLGIVAALLVLTAFVVSGVGFANAMALRSKSIGGYHTILFLLTLPLLFLEFGALSTGDDAGLDARCGVAQPDDLCCRGNARYTLWRWQPESRALSRGVDDFCHALHLVWRANVPSRCVKGDRVRGRND
ncbi:MAG: ABC transporter permease [Anaerolineales bacterium]|nr:ABC transporter permease [Anaerolineales bacterium]